MSRKQLRCIVIGCDRYSAHPFKHPKDHGRMPLLCRLGLHRYAWFKYCRRCGRRK